MARNKDFDHFPTHYSGFIAQIILPFPFPFFAAIGGSKRHASATARNFVLYRWHLALRSIAIIKRHALPSALTVTRYHRHQAPIREVRVKTAKVSKDK